MFNGFFTLLGRFDQNAQTLFNFFLSDIFVKTTGPQGGVQREVLGVLGGGGGDSHNGGEYG